MLAKKTLKGVCYFITRDPMGQGMVATWDNFSNLTCDGISPELLDKSDCNEGNYWLKFEGKIGTQQGNDCITQHQQYIQNCDCSDPDSYDFYDEGGVLESGFPIL